MLEKVFRSDNKTMDKDAFHSLISSIKILSTPFSPLAVIRQIASQNEAQGKDDAFFVMSIDQIVCQHKEWERKLPRVHPHYAVKCNNDPVLLRVLASLNCGFDCASKQEIESVLEIDGVRRMTFDNEEELHKIQSVFPEAELVLRIAVSDKTAVCPLNVKFGCDPISVAPDLLKKAAALELRVVGVSFHVGSGCRDASAFAEAIFYSKKLFEIGRLSGLPMNLLDIGGGYPGFPNKDITFSMIAGVINEALNRNFPSDSEVKIIAEPGRFYAASAFSLCCNIIAKTRTPVSKITGRSSDEGEGFMYYINDGVYGSFNCILYDHFQPRGAALFQEGEEEIVSSVWGPTCDGLDLVLPQCMLPAMREGRWILFQNMGAYTCAAGSEFNGFPRPKVYYHASDMLLSSVDARAYCVSEIEDDQESLSDSQSSSVAGFSSDGTDSS